jgi:hypothetical protein
MGIYGGRKGFEPMAVDSLSKKIYRNLFTEDQWDLIYCMIGNALDGDLFDHEDVYAIRNKIHILLDMNS